MQPLCYVRMNDFGGSFAQGLLMSITGQSLGHSLRKHFSRIHYTDGVVYETVKVSATPTGEQDCQ